MKLASGAWKFEMKCRFFFKLVDSCPKVRDRNPLGCKTRLRRPVAETRYLGNFGRTIPYVLFARFMSKTAERISMKTAKGTEYAVRLVVVVVVVMVVVVVVVLLLWWWWWW